MDDQTHTYNLKAVVMETGLKPVTLRAWERRYGLPEPSRTSGKHRLYSQRDIDMLKWMVARQKEGVSISQAISLWRNIQTDGQDPLTIGSPITGTAASIVLPEASGEQLAGLRQAWIEAILAFDEAHLDQIMLQAFSQFPAEIVCLELLQKGLAEIGQGWYEGQVTVQQEHFASAQAMRRLEMLVAAQPPPTRSERILVGCATKDTHTFSPLLLTFLLRRHGWNVIYLGADVPGEQMVQTIKATEPDLVIFTAQVLFTAVSLLSIGQMLAHQHIPFAFGGLAFIQHPELTQMIPGHYLGNKMLDVPRQVQQLFVNNPEPVSTRPVSPQYQIAYHQYERCRMLIEAAIWEKFEQFGLPVELFSDINIYFGRDVSAALQFGNIELVNSNLEWLLVLLENHNRSQQELDYYLQTYLIAAAAYLPETNHPLLSWLRQKLDHE